MELNEIIAENLKRLRTERGLSLGRLSELSGVSKVMLSQVEKGAGFGDSGICHGRRGFYTVRFLPPPYVYQSGRGHDRIYQYCLLRRIREDNYVLGWMSFIGVKGVSCHG